MHRWMCPILDAVAMEPSLAVAARPGEGRAATTLPATAAARRHRRAATAAGVVLLLGLAGCTPDWPMDRPGTWHLGPTGANDVNLKTMIVNPHDLVAGAGEANTLGPEAAAPVERLLTGHRTPLPQSSAAQFNQTGGQQQQQPGAQGNSVGQ